MGRESRSMHGVGGGHGNVLGGGAKSRSMGGTCRMVRHRFEVDVEEVGQLIDRYPSGGSHGEGRGVDLWRVDVRIGRSCDGVGIRSEATPPGSWAPNLVPYAAMALPLMVVASVASGAAPST